MSTGNKKQNKGGVSGGKTATNAEQLKPQTNSPEVAQPVLIPPYMGPQAMYQPPFPQFAPFQAYPTTQSNNENLLELVHEINHRLKGIELKVEKISPIEKDITYLKTQFHDFRKESNSMAQRITEVETFCQTYSDVTDQVINSRSHFDAELTKMKHYNIQLENQVDMLNTQNIDLKTRCLDLQTKYMENELIFFGIDEARRDGQSNRESVEETLRSMIKAKLQDDVDIYNEAPVTVETITFKRVHRVGNPARVLETGRPRPIVAQFEKFSDRDAVRKAGTILNKKQASIKVHEHYPKEIEARRKQLYPVVRKLADLDHDVKLVKDRLYVNNTLYNPNTGVYVDKLGNRQVLQRQAYLPAQRQQNRYHGQPHPPRYDNYRPHDQRPTQPRLINFETPNRFSQLNMDDERSVQQKRKDRSPLDLETSVKRYVPEQTHSSNINFGDSQSSAVTIEHSDTSTDVARASFATPSDHKTQEPMEEPQPYITN